MKSHMFMCIKITICLPPKFLEFSLFTAHSTSSVGWISRQLIDTCWMSRCLYWIEHWRQETWIRSDFLFASLRLLNVATMSPNEQLNAVQRLLHLWKRWNRIEGLKLTNKNVSFAFFYQAAMARILSTSHLEEGQKGFELTTSEYQVQDDVI